jgi:small subunit ribosomal protein S17
MTDQPAARRKARQTKLGRVVSDKMDQTVIVEVLRTVRHPRYRRYLRRRSRFVAHNAGDAASMGDRVLIEETRPLSRRKRWSVREIVEKAAE